MIKIKEIQPDHIYLFSGKASANSLLVESLTEAHEFINSANTRFKNFMKIREYLITEDGWSFICEIESKELIMTTYLRNRSNSKRTYKNPPFAEAWRIVSEQVRHWLSRFVKNCNFSQGRTGGKVHSNYEKRVFESVVEAEQYIVNMQEQKHDYGQLTSKYRGDRRFYKVSKRHKKGHIFLCSKNLKVLLGKAVGAFGAITSLHFDQQVLRKLITSTLKFHFPHLNHNFIPKMI